MSAPFFSIITPVYNDEKNLSRCLESILSQTFKEFELILINDGSNDSTPLICDNYAQKDTRFCIFHKDNEGISKTRQFGIDKSNGLYIIFVDSDDWIESSYLEKTYQKIITQSSDIIFFDFFNENASSEEIYYNQKPSSIEVDSIIKNVLEGRQFSCLWNVIIKKSFITQKNIKFSEKINYGEDTLFITEILLNNPAIEHIDNAFYHHTFNHNSYTRKNKKTRFYERVKFLNELEALINNYSRTELIVNNFFPFNDKFQILCSGIFTYKEYKHIIPLSFSLYYKQNTKKIKYLILMLAETKLYFFCKIICKFYFYKKYV